MPRRLPLFGWGASESVLNSNTCSVFGTVLTSSMATLDVGEEGAVARPGGADKEEEGMDEVTSAPTPLSWSMRSSTSPYPTFWVESLIPEAGMFGLSKTSLSNHCRRRERWPGETRNIIYLYLEKRWDQLMPVTAPPLEVKYGSGPQTKVTCDMKSS